MSSLQGCPSVEKPGEPKVRAELGVREGVWCVGVGVTVAWTGDKGPVGQKLGLGGQACWIHQDLALMWEDQVRVDRR